MAKLFGWKIDKICFYPYGGVTKFDADLNKPRYQEMFVMIAGPIIQIIYFNIIIHFLTLSEYIMFKEYYYSILFFNLLPIVPLDGGKFLNVLFNYFFSFRRSFKLAVFLSYAFIIGIFIYLYLKNISISLSLILVIVLIICKLTQEFRKEKFYFNKFLLERYLNNYKFKKVKVIKGINDMSRDYKHVFFNGKKAKTEHEELNKYFYH